MINCRQLSVSAIKISAVVHQCTCLLMHTHTHFCDNICTFRFTEVTKEVLQLSRDFICIHFPGVLCLLSPSLSCTLGMFTEMKCCDTAMNGMFVFLRSSHSMKWFNT